MQLLQLIGLALLATQHVASVPADPGFTVIKRDDCGDDDGSLGKRAACTQPVQCGGRAYPLHSLCTSWN